MKKLTIEFHGDSYLLIGSLETEGPIATREQYKNGETSFAYLCSDGYVRRFNKVIGCRDDIIVTGETEIEMEASMHQVVANIFRALLDRPVTKEAA